MIEEAAQTVARAAMCAALGYAIGIYWRSIMEKTALLTERLPRDEVEIEGVGTVTVRGLSRYELLLAGKGQNDDVAAMERRMLAMAMVDPEMSEDDVAAWQKCSPAGEIMPIVNKINELSGVGREAQKEAYKSLRDES